MAPLLNKSRVMLLWHSLKDQIQAVTDAAFVRTWEEFKRIFSRFFQLSKRLPENLRI